MAALTGRIRTLLSLRAVRGVGDVRLTALLRTHGSPAAAFAALSTEQSAAVNRIREPRIARRIDHVLASLARQPDIRVIAACDAAYPEALLELHDPPPVLFVRGQTSLLGRMGVAVVGTRACTEYGADATRLICEILGAEGVPVVSGLAHGIDRVAHETTLESDGPTVAVIGCGIDVAYPHEHEKLQETIARDGLLVSEFPPGAPALAHHFPKRNRIIAALGRVVVVVEAPSRSGALITVDHALDLGREVMAVPGPIGRRTSEGTNAMIRDGATIVTDAADVLTVFRETAGSRSTPPEAIAGRRRAHRADGERPGPGAESGSAVPAHAAGERPMRRQNDRGARIASRSISGPAAAISAALGAEPAHADDLGSAAGMPAGATLAALLELELAGIAQALPGGRYRLARRSPGSWTSEHA